MVSPASMGPPLQLNSTGKLISPKATLRNFSATASPAGAIRSGMVSASAFSRPRQLNSTGICISRNRSVLNRSARASPAGAISRVWKGPLTFSGTTRLAPAWRASSPAFSTAAASPAMTSWVGQL